MGPERGLRRRRPHAPERRARRHRAGLDLTRGHPSRILAGRPDTPTIAVDFSPDGRTLAAADDDGDVRLWSPRTGRTLRVLPGSGRSVRCLAFSPDGRTLATDAKDGIRLRTAATVRDLGVLPAPAPWSCSDLAFSRDGRTLAAGGLKGVVLWDLVASTVRTGRNRTSSPVNAVAFSPEGHRLAAGASGEVGIWGTRTGSVLQVLRGRQGSTVDGVAFSPDGRTLAGGDLDGSVRLWTAAGQVRRLLDAGRNGVRDLLLTPDGRTSVTATGDTVRLWDPVTGRAIGSFSDEGLTLAVSPDGPTVAAAGGDEVRLHPCLACLPIRELQARARRMAGRELSAEERRIYVIG